MSHITMEMTHGGSHLHNGLSSYPHHTGVLGHIGIGSSGDSVGSTHQHTPCSPAGERVAIIKGCRLSCKDLLFVLINYLFDLPASKLLSIFILLLCGWCAEE